MLYQFSAKSEQGVPRYSNHQLDPLYTFGKVNYTTHNNNNNTQGSLDFNIKNKSLMALNGDSYDPQKPHLN